MKRLWAKIIVIWKDPVWSKVIATGIVVGIGFLWTRYSDTPLTEIWHCILKFLSFTIPIYSFLAAIGFIYIIVKIGNFLMKRNDIGSEPMGNFTFKELYLILQNQNLPVGTVGMGYSNMRPPQEDLLSLFQMYISYMNTGVTLEHPRDDGGYLYGVLCPKLMSYGLIDKVETKNKNFDITEIKYQTSDLGKKFYSFVEKITHLNPKRR